MFAIDSGNNIAVYAEVPADAENLQTFDSEKDLAKLAADWPAMRLVELRNSFAGGTLGGVVRGTRRRTATSATSVTSFQIPHICNAR